MTALQSPKKTKQEMCENFRGNDLKIVINANLSVVDYLDVTLDQTWDEFRPYMKPKDKPLHVQKLSNHPPAGLKNKFLFYLFDYKYSRDFLTRLRK